MSGSRLGDAWPWSPRARERRAAARRARASSPRVFPWLLVLGVLATALSLRGPILALSPVLRDIEHDLGITSATAGLLTTAPVLMFAVLTPAAASVIRRAGPERAVLLALLGVLVGTGIRAIPGFGWMVVGMIVIGAAITVGNVVMPVVIRRDVPPERVPLVTAAYTSLLNAGSLVTSLFTAPIAEATGWPFALAVWGVLTIVGLAVWGVHMDRRRHALADRPAETEDEGVAPTTASLPVEASTGAVRTAGHGTTPMTRRPVVWLLTAAFVCQASMYYALSAWLPAMTSDLLGYSATTAAALASLFQGVAVIGAFVVPALARIPNRFAGAALVNVTWLIAAVGMLLAPQWVWVWLSIGGIGQAGGFVVIFSVLVAVSRNDRDAAVGSALVQGVGYGVAAASAPLLGALHDATGGWTVPLIAIIVVALAYFVALFLAVASRGREG